MTTVKRHVLGGSLAAAVLLAGCGGGGDDAGGGGFIPPPAGDFKVEAGWKNLLLTGGDWTVVGTGSDGFTYEARLMIAPAAAAVFPPTAVSYARTTITSTLKRSGVSLGTGVNEYFRDAGFLVQAVRSTAAGSADNCAQATASVLPPTASKVNTQGALMTLDELNTCNVGALKVGTTTATWSMEFEKSIALQRSIPLMCLNSVSRDATNQITATESDCVEIAETGTLGTSARISINFPGNFTLVARNYNL